MMFWVSSIVFGALGGLLGRWLVRWWLRVCEGQPTGRQLARDVLAATDDKRVTAVEREHLRDEARKILS